MKDVDLNSKLILNLSLYGVLVGIAGVMGFVRNVEWTLWFIGWAGASAIVAKKCRMNYFLNSFVTGFLIAFLSELIKVALFDTYTENNPRFLQNLTDNRYDVDPKMYIISLGLITAIFSGLVTGFLTLGFRKFFPEKVKK